MKQFDIMLQANVITKKQHNILSHTEIQIRHWNPLEKERFLMHLAMTLVRITKNEQVAPLNQVVRNEITANPLLKAANRYLKTLFHNFQITFPKQELVYLQMHVINFLKKEKNRENRNWRPIKQAGNC